jgi:hypothetical protein
MRYGAMKRPTARTVPGLWLQQQPKPNPETLTGLMI